MAAVASVVIPAHQEAAVLARCLSALLDGPLELSVVVVANGCTDRTAEIARELGVAVVETSRPGKAHALDLGDRASSGFPRAYLDADVVLPQAALAATLGALARGALVAAPRLRTDQTGCSWPVRAYYRVWTALPYVTEAMVGSGVYVLSETGRGRFGTFPDAIGDDTFVRSLFHASERAGVPQAFTVFPPRTLRSLLAVKTRVRAGIAQQDAVRGSPTAATWQALRRRPDLWGSVPVYLAVTALTSARGRRRARRGDLSTWARDLTSRSPSVRKKDR